MYDDMLKTDNESVKLETEGIRQSTLLNAKVNTELNQDTLYSTVLPIPSSKIVTRYVDRSDFLQE